jgi:hypothetical protein
LPWRFIYMTSELLLPWGGAARAFSCTTQPYASHLAVHPSGAGWAGILTVLSEHTAASIFQGATLVKPHGAKGQLSEGRAGGAEELDDYDIEDGGMYIVTVTANDALQGVVDAFTAQFHPPSRVFSSLGMFSSNLSMKEVRGGSECIGVAFVDSRLEHPGLKSS